jgi:hypothetical protein
MPKVRLSSETVVGAALMRFGITVLPFGTADHDPEWMQGNTREKLERRFGSLFPASRKALDPIVIVVDNFDRQFVVTNIEELERVWRMGQIAYTLKLTRAAYEAIRGDIALHDVPKFEPA